MGLKHNAWARSSGLPLFGMAVVGTLLGARSASAAKLLQYTFDEASSGTTAALNTGTFVGENGSFIADATRTAATPNGASVGALNLSGVSGGYLGTSTSPDVIDGFTPTSGFTMMTWINLRATPTAGDALIANSGSTSGLVWDIQAPNTGTLAANDFSLRLISRNSGTITSPKSSVDVETTAGNTWVFVAVSYSTTGSIQYYSGTETAGVSALGVASAFGGIGPNFNSGSVNLRVGSSGLTVDREPNAYFDDVRIYDEVLGATALDAIRQENLGATPEPAGLLGLATAGLTLLARKRRSHA